MFQHPRLECCLRVLLLRALLCGGLGRTDADRDVSLPSRPQELGNLTMTLKCPELTTVGSLHALSMEKLANMRVGNKQKLDPSDFILTRERVAPGEVGAFCQCLTARRSPPAEKQLRMALLALAGHQPKAKARPG